MGFNTMVITKFNKENAEAIGKGRLKGQQCGYTMTLKVKHKMDGETVLPNMRAV
jgi:hypothetical protein